MRKVIQKSAIGQTLIELLVTILFIAVGVIALIRFQNYLSYNNTLTQQKGYATTLAISQIETLKDFQVLNTTSGYTAYSGIASGTSTVNGPNATYALAWTVTSYTNPTYKNIDLTVSWTDRAGNNQSIRFVTNIAGIDPQTSASIM